MIVMCEEANDNYSNNSNSNVLVDNDVKLRKINCELLPLTRADGSALLTQGETTVLASTSGPIEVKLSNQKIDNATIEVYYKSKSGLPTLKDRQNETIIKNICETAILTALHPRTAISIQIQEMENKCGLEACAINAVCLALLVGSVPLKYTVAAVHCIIDKNNRLILDPDDILAKNCLANFTFVFDSLQKNLIAVNTNGKFNLAQFNDAVTYCKAASDIIFQFYRKIVIKLLTK